MKILFIAHEATRTGAPTVLLNVIKKLKEEKFHCDLLLLSGGDLESEFRSVTDKLVFVKGNSVILKVLAKGLRQIPEKIIAFIICHKIKLRNYDFIYANSVSTLILAIELKKRLNIKILLHVHELEYAINSFVGKEKFKEYSKLADSFIAVSKVNKECLVNEYEIDPKRIAILYPYPNSTSTVQDDKLLDELGITHDTFVIGGSGQMSWIKGIDIFMIIANEFSKRTRFKNYKFVWVGGFPIPKNEFEQFQLMKKKLEYKDIYFTGEVKNPYDYYNYFSVFLLTSKEESFSLVAVENALLKKPVVCFENCGGVNEWAKEQSGIEVPFCDISQAVEVLLNLSESPEKRKELGTNAFEIVTQKFNEKVFKRELLEIINNVARLS